MRGASPGPPGLGVDSLADQYVRCLQRSSGSIMFDVLLAPSPWCVCSSQDLCVPVDAYSLLASTVCLSKSLFHPFFFYLFVIASSIPFMCTLVSHGRREGTVRMLEFKSRRARSADRSLGAESRSSRLRGSLILSADIRQEIGERAMKTYLPSLALQRMFLAMVMLSLVPLLAVVGVFLDMPAAHQ